MSPQIFRTPRRRLTRQRSGYHVAGDRVGSEAILARARHFLINSNDIEFKIENSDIVFEEQFHTPFGLAAAGGYIKTEKPLFLTIFLKASESISGKVIGRIRKRNATYPSTWQAFGLHFLINDVRQYKRIDLEYLIHLHSNDGVVGDIQLFGINTDAVNAFSSHESQDQFKMKTEIYIPGIYYFKEDRDFLIEPTEIKGELSTVSEGEQVVLKACNRCSRYLIIDIHNEHNGLGFSNHCIQRAPCRHNAFSRYIIQNSKEIEIDLALLGTGKIIERNEKYFIITNNGFQLECRSCKKFKVNAPLNPMRNGTQHREDSLRRRAFEQLLLNLLGRKWVFFEHRLTHGSEFDVFIWEKYNKKCFGCGIDLSSINIMNLDHTMPLNYLWPLDDTATCLCQTCNSQKNNKFPFEFERYRSVGKLRQLSEISGLPYKILRNQRRQINLVAVKELRKRIIWFFEEFLMHPDFQKVRQGKKASDLIVASLQRVFLETGVKWNLVEEYTNITGKPPDSISLMAVEAEITTMTESGIDV